MDKADKDDHDRCEWVNVSFWYRLTWVVLGKIQRAVKTVVFVCVRVCDSSVLIQ